jgi:hypothetical protein
MMTEDSHDFAEKRETKQPTRKIPNCFASVKILPF